MARPVRVDALRKRALRMIAARMRENNVTTADLIRISGMEDPPPSTDFVGDLVLYVRQDDMPQADYDEDE